MSAASDRADAYAGEPAIFQVTVANAGLLGRETAFNATRLPPGWLYAFSPARVEVPPNGTNATTLVVHVPADAAPGDVAPLSFVAWDDGGFSQGALSEPLHLNVTVVARPVVAPAQPAPPPLLLSVGASSAPAGSTAEGRLTLYTDARQLDVRLAGDGARFPEGDFVRVYPTLPADVKVVATAPAPGTTRSFAVTATVDSFVFTALWNVTGTAPTPLPAPAATDEAAAPAPRPDPAASGAPPAPEAGLEVLAPAGPLEVAPGGVGSGTLTLRNAGAQTVRLALRGDAADGWPVTITPGVATLDPGVTLPVTFAVQAPREVAPGGAGSGTITITGDDGLLRGVPFQLAVVPAAKAFDAPPAGADGAVKPVPVDADPGAALAVAGGVAAVGAAALVLARRPWRETLLWGALGLYTRLARPDVLGHEERGRLHRAIETQPGIHFHALQRELAWNTGTLTYHLRVLERHGFVVSRRDGPYRRFYVQGAAPRKEAFNPGAPHGLRADVLEAVRGRHGVSQTDLALALGANKQTVNYHVKALERAGAIRIEKRGRETFLYPAEAGVKTGPDAG